MLQVTLVLTCSFAIIHLFKKKKKEKKIYLMHLAKKKKALVFHALKIMLHRCQHRWTNILSLEHVSNIMRVKWNVLQVVTLMRPYHPFQTHHARPRFSFFCLQKSSKIGVLLQSLSPSLSLFFGLDWGGYGWTLDTNVCQTHDKRVLYAQRMQIDLLLLCIDREPKPGQR